jgi:fumarate reductase subunit D
MSEARVPEPGVWALFGLAAAIGAIVSRKRK